MGMDPFRWGAFGAPYLAPQSLGYPFGLPQTYWDARNQMAGAPASILPFQTGGLQSMQAPVWPMAAGMGQMPGTMSPFANGGLPPEQSVEVQAITGFLQDASSNAIKKLFDYFSANSEKYPQLANGVTLLNQAVDSFKAHDLPRSFSQVYDVYRYIAAVRLSVPDLPALA